MCRLQTFTILNEISAITFTHDVKQEPREARFGGNESKPNKFWRVKASSVNSKYFIADIYIYIYIYFFFIRKYCILSVIHL